MIAPSGICGSAGWYDKALGSVESSICGAAGGFPLDARFWGFRFTQFHEEDAILLFNGGPISRRDVLNITPLGIEDDPVALAEHVIY